MLKLAPDLSLPVEAVTQTIGIVARKRSGKSFLARRLTEQLHLEGQQVVVVDPKGDWWGILSSADGKGPGLPFLIIGGERGHVPLEASGGEVVAKLVVEERVSAVIDCSLLRKHEIATFMAVFLESLYRLKAAERFRTPLMLAIDEADAIAPQKPQPNEARMLGAAEDIVRRGGQRGIGCTMITQRTAVLNKNILTQCQVLISLRTTSPQDLAAMNEWITVHGSKEQQKTLMASLPSLPIGDAWVWSPGWPTDAGIFQRVHTLPIGTFDSGATPKPGQKRVEPKKMADVDMEAVRAQMAATIERAKENDPKELKARIVHLQKLLHAKAAPVDTGLAEENESLRARVAELGALLKSDEELRNLADDLQVLANRARGALVQPANRPPQFWTGPRIEQPLAETEITFHHGPKTLPPIGVTVRPKAKQPSPAAAGNAGLPEGERKILTVIAQTRGGATREQVSLIAGYKRSTRDRYIQYLAAKGLVDVGGATLRATQAGLDALGSDFEPLPTGDALLQHWLGQLPEGERKILAFVARHRRVTRDDISAAIALQRSTRDRYIQYLAARKLVTSTREGVVASEELFG